MRYRQFLISTTILSASALMLAGCASSPGKLAVDLDALKECQKLDHPLTLAQIGEDSDYRNLSAEALGEIKKANLARARRLKCEDSVIQKYKEAKS